MISLENVTFGYSQKPVIDHIDLTLERGERVAVMGPNGSGKSTLALLIKGLLTPNEGKIYIDGSTPSETPPNVVGLVFQNPENQIAAATVEREIAFGLENLGMPRQNMLRKVDEVLEKFGLIKYRKHPSHLLSGGQLQKLALAAVFALQPQYLLLDEPTSLLDSQARIDFINKLFSLPEDTGIIFITQFPREALKYKRLIALLQGKVFYDGSPADFFSDEELTAASGIEPPVEISLKKWLGR